jgi:hypothetical protein
MNDTNGYAVFFFPQALELLGDPIRPFLQEGPAGPHVACTTIDTGGAFIEMTIDGHTPEGRVIALELMVPSSMVRMVVSTQSEAMFGFGLRHARPGTVELPIPGPTAERADASSTSLPTTAQAKQSAT